MKPAALVFDLDDTLYAEREFVLSGFAATDVWLRENRNIDGFYAEAVRLFVAGMRGKIFDTVLTSLEIADERELVPKLVDIYRAHKPLITLPEDSRWALERFRSSFKLGLITDGYAQTQRNKVGALGIGACFDHIVYTDDLGRENWKPSPVAFKLMMDRLGMTGPECVYVGDNVRKDFAAPNALGWLTVLISREGGEYKKMAEEAMPHGCGATEKVSSLRELSLLLGVS